MTPPDFAYRCSDCDKLVAKESLVKHMEAHKNDGFWKGVCSFTRVDGPFLEEIIYHDASVAFGL